MANNFGSRDIRKSGKFALTSAMLSFSSIATMAYRWRRFCDFLEQEIGYASLHEIDRSMVQRYGVHLYEQCQSGAMSPATAQNYLSAVNRVMEIIRGDRYCYVSAVHEALIPRRHSIAETNKAISDSEHENALQELPQPIAAMICLQRELGLRFEESAKLHAILALRQAQSDAEIEVVDGTKGGLDRIVPITNERQMQALRDAAQVQRGRSMIPAEMSYRQFREFAYIEARRAGIRFHGERHWYAQRRYREIVGADCPVVSGVSRGNAHIAYLSDKLGVSVDEASKRDRRAREKVSRELGHSRFSITNNYLG
ncbi:MAG: integrase [Gammaproteobacteria bacterium]|nr:integrase [Gammaproteobacteria bacterium]MBJ55660.1 integrase [Gammaproteobacteria bacterium]|tara:strand:- start:205 stop:1140 length:936 start_codon:yes stop_codon:yes gene_type:complete